MSFSARRATGRIHPDASPPPDELAGSQGGSLPTSPTASGAVLKKTLTQSFSVRRRHRSSASARERAQAEEAAKRLTVPAEEHTEWLRERARKEGRESALSLLKFYGIMLLPVAYVTALMFGVFGGMSWAVPNLLCNRIAKENSAASFGMATCIYNDVGREGSYSYRWGAKLFWLLYWSILTPWQTFFPTMVTYLMCGNAFLRREKAAIGVILFLELISMPVLCTAFNKPLNDVRVIGFIMSVGFTTTVICSHVVARYTGSRATGSRYFMFVFMAGNVVVLYNMFIPLMITGRAQEALGGMGLTIFRIVVHPAIWSMVLTWFRFVMRNIGFVPEMTSVIFLTWPYLYASMYGRFLLLQLDNVGSVVVMNLVFNCFDLAGQLSDRAVDGFILKLIFGERGRDAIIAAREHDDRHTAEVFTSLMMEMASIFAASALLSLGGVASAPGVGPNHNLIWTNALAQALTTLVFCFLGLAMEGKYHNFEWEKSWVRHKVRLMVGLTLVCFFGGSQLCIALLGLFCPVYYPEEDKVLLEQCDKPSIFQALTFSSANRFKMIGDYFATSVNA